MFENQLCDVCRQNPADHYFVDPHHARGVIHRQVCSRCRMLTPGQQQALVTIDLLGRGEGKCQFCGGLAQEMSGIPGPDRRVACYDCAIKIDR